MSYKICEYDPEWPKRFEKIKGIILSVFNKKALAVEHVGSTSIVGMKAKPLIDVLALVENIETLSEEKLKMIELGYVCKENVLIARSLLFEKLVGKEKVENIHVMESGADKANQFLYMRDYFRSHPDKVKEYENIKDKLFAEFPDDYLAYRAGKDRFLKDIEKLAREWKGI